MPMKLNHFSTESRSQYVRAVSFHSHEEDHSTSVRQRSESRDPDNLTGELELAADPICTVFQRNWNIPPVEQLQLTPSLMVFAGNGSLRRSGLTTRRLIIIQTAQKRLQLKQTRVPLQIHQSCITVMLERGLADAQLAVGVGERRVYSINSVQGEGSGGEKER
ncbi:unnamed protein product [Pleuronectes platessa]|uniref:Uncharacterized protein n=1 Tax=Pleuronectes platessa TaxID=8262 RepID=A0A9N7VEP8_PLEPL|nr:unnamed protein product [Pleuronectes platessa]